MGKNALPSNEDMGAVAAHILKDPARHAGKTYRPTGPEILSTQEMADIIGKILGRQVVAQKMSAHMFRKAVKAAGLPIYTYSQVPYYNEEAFNGTMEVSAPTSVVKDIVGREPEDFETIARRYIAESSVAQPSVVNKLRALKNFMKVMLTRIPDLETYHRTQGHPTLSNPEFSVPSGDGRNPSPSGEAKGVVVWSRAAVPIRSAHEDGPESSSGLDPEIPKAGFGWSGRGSCARSAPADCDGARVDDLVGKSGTRSRPRVCLVSPESGHQHDRSVAERGQLESAPSGVSSPPQSVLGKALLGARLPRRDIRHDH